MFRAYHLLTHGLGSQRRLIRRIAALCLVLMGVHLAADHLDDLIYTGLDAIDLVVDDTVAGFLSWLASAGGMTPEAAIHRADAFATWVDLAEKDKLAIAFALGAELLLDLLLVDLVWGRHVDESAPGLFGELIQSGKQMVDALRPLDLERLAVVPTLLAYATGGALMAALAVEGIARETLQKTAPDFLWAGPAAASIGMGAASLLLWRFLPDLLHGALLRSRARHDTARARALQDLEKAHRFPRLARFTTLLGLGSRGAWLLAIALPLAVAGLLSHDLAALVSRVEVAGPAEMGGPG